MAFLQSHKPTSAETGSKPSVYQLETRILFDAAAPAVITDIPQEDNNQSSANDPVPVDEASPSDDISPQEIEEQTKDEAQELADILSDEDQSSPSATQADPLIQALTDSPEQEDTSQESSHTTTESAQEAAGETTGLIEQEEQQESSPTVVAELSGSKSENEHNDTLLVIDSAVDDYEELVENADKTVKVIVIDEGEDGISAISKHLAEEETISSLHIISHGSEGSISLGGAQIDNSTIAERSSELSLWSEFMSEDGDILLYGCSVAEDSGEQFIQSLADVTRADVAASTDATGAAQLNGNWILEAQTGQIESSLPFSDAVLNEYDHLLAAPTIDGTADLLSVDEDTDLTINTVSIDDTDGDALQITLTAADGTVSLSTLTNLSVDSGANGSATITVSGAVADINAALSGMIYRAPQNFNGNTSIVIEVTDDPDGDSIYAGDADDSEITSTATLNIEVIQINDAPELSPTPLTVQEHESGVAFSDANFGLTDIDIDTGQQVLAQQIVEIKSLPTEGELKYNGSPVVVGSSFSYTNLDKLTYSHGGADVALSSNNTDSFTVNVTDGAGGETGITTIAIDLTPKNTAPTISGSPTVFEGQTTGLGLSWSDEESGHADSAANTTVTISNVDNQGEGTLFFDANNNNIVDAGEELTSNTATNPAINADQLDRIKFQHNGDEPVNTPTFDVTVTDAGGGEGPASALSATQTISIQLREVDDDPTLAANRDGLNNSPNEDGDTDNSDYGTVSGDFFDVGGDSTKIITTTDLQVVDVDSDVQNLVYTITSDPVYGNLELEISPGVWANLNSGDRFTQDQIDQGKIRFNYTSEVSAENTIDNFSYTVRDSELKAWQEPGPEPAADNTGQEGGIYDGNSPALKEFTFNILLDPWTGAGGGPPGTDIDLDLNGVISNVGTEVYEGESNVIDTNLINYRSYSGDPDSPDYEIPANEILFRITSLATNGSIQKDLGGGNWVTVDLYDHFSQEDINNGAVRFVQNGSEDFQSFFTFSITDGTNEEVQTFKTETTPINDAPVATGGVVEATEAVIGDDTSGIVRITDTHIGMSDADEAEESAKRSEEQGDKDSLWFAVSDLPDDGTLEYYNGVSWTELTASDLYGDAAGDVLWFSKSILTMSVDGGTSGIRYVHGGEDDAASLSDNFKFYVRDDLAAPAGNTITDAVISGQTEVPNTPLDTPSAQPQTNPPSSYIDGNNLSNEATVTIEVAAFNDPPQVPTNYNTADESISGTITDGGATTEANQLLEMAEGGTETITSAYLTAIDPDNTTVQRQYKVTDIVDHGTLKLNGSALSVGSTFTQADIDNNRITYTHNGSENFQDYFSFIVDDGLATDSGRFDIVITEPLNDLPSITVPADQYYDNTAPFEFGGSGKRIGISDPDLVSVSTGETDFVQAVISSDNANAIFSLSSVPAGLTVLAGNGIRNQSLVIQGNLADVQTALDNLELTFKDASNADIDLDSDVQISVGIDDRLRDNSGALTTGANGGTANENGSPINSTNNIASDSFILHASNVNDVPTISSSPTGPVEAIEDTWSNIDTYEFDDVDAFSTSNNSVTVEVRKQDDSGAGTGQVRVTNSGGATVSGNASGSLTLTGTLTQINAALTNLQYLGAADFNGSELLKVTYSDNGNVGVGAAVPVVDTVQVDVRPVNDAPDVTFNGGNSPVTQYVTADADFIFQAANSNLIAISDSSDVNKDSTPIDEYTVTIQAESGGSGYGTLTLSKTTGLNVAGNGTSAITITASSMADINSALDGLIFNSGEPDADRAATITVNLDDLDNGGTRIGGNTGPHTDQLVIDLIISSVNDAPTDDSTTTNPVEAVEDTWATINGSNSFAFADVDTFGSDANTVVVSAASGTLRVSSLAGSASINDPAANSGGGSGSASITITGTLTDINATLQNLQYRASLDLNGAAQDTISATYTDTGNPGGTGSDKLSTTSSRSVNIAAVNDAPTKLINEVSLPTQNEDDLTPPSGTLGELLNHATDPAHQAFSDARDDISGGSNPDDFTSIVVVANTADSGNEGSWQYYNGSSWETIPTDLTATSGLVLTLATQVRFVPVTDFNGAPGDLTVRLVEGDANSDAPGGAGSTAVGVRIDVGGANSGGVTTYSNASNEVLIKTSVTAVNDSPTTPLTTGTAVVTEDAWSSISGPSALSFSDVDTGSSTNNTVAIHVDQGDIRVTLSGSAAITAGSNESGALTLTGSLADINATLASLEYRGEQDENGLNKATLTATYDDQGNSGTGSAPTEATLSRSLHITAINDAPTKLINEVSLPTTQEAVPSADNQTVSTLLTPAFDDSVDAVVGGSFADNFSSVVIVNNAADSSTEGVWEYRDGGTWTAISEALTPANGLVLSAGAEIRFNPTDDFTGTPGKLTVRLGEDDNAIPDVPPSGIGGGANTISGSVVDLSGANSGDATPYSDSDNAVLIGINITPINDPPVNTVPGAQTVDEDNALIFSSAGGNGLSISDPDVNETPAPDNILQTTVSVSHGTLDLNNGSGALLTDDTTSTVTIQGTLDQINQALEGMIYTPDKDYSGTDTLTITTNDLGNTGAGGPLSDTDTVAITINQVVSDDPPTADPFYGKTVNTQSITVVLHGEDVDGDLQELEITSLPDAAKGTLYRPDGTTPVVIGDLFTPTDAAQLIFTPLPGSSGTVTFEYFARDAANNISTDAQVRILITDVPVVEPLGKPLGPQPNPTPGSGPTAPETTFSPGSPQFPAPIPTSKSQPSVTQSIDVDLSFPETQDTSTNSYELFQNGDMASPFAENEQNWFYLDLADKTYEVEKTSEYRIPAAAIHHTDPNATITFVANKSDDSSLPPWITFDEEERAFLITPPSGAPDELVLKVKAIDEWGNEAEAFFTIRIVNHDTRMPDHQPEERPAKEVSKTLPDQEHLKPAAHEQQASLLENALQDEQEQVPTKEKQDQQEGTEGKPAFSAQLSFNGRQQILDDSAELLNALIN